MNNCLSIDLGTQQDYTVFSVLQRTEMFRERTTIAGTPADEREVRTVISRYNLRHLERPQLGVKYPDIIRRTQEIMDHPALKDNCWLVVDATGVGLPVVQMMRENGLYPIAVSITGGNAPTESRIGGYNVPKRDLVQSLVRVFQSRRITVPADLELKDVFIKELQAFTMKLAKKDTYEGMQEHDDVVMSAAMGVWWLEQCYGDLLQQAPKSSSSYTGFDPFSA